MRSDEAKVAPPSRGFNKLKTRKEIELAPGSKCRFNFRVLKVGFWPAGFIVVLVMVLLSTSYLESSLKIWTQRKLDLGQVESLPNFYSSPSQIIQEDSHTIPSIESGQVGNSNFEQPRRDSESEALLDNPVDDEKVTKDGPAVPLLEQDTRQEGEENFTGYTDEEHGQEDTQMEKVEDQSTTNSAEAEEHEKKIEFFSSDLTQDDSLKSAGREEEKVGLKDAQDGSHAEKNYIGYTEEEHVQETPSAPIEQVEDLSTTNSAETEEQEKKIELPQNGTEEEIVDLKDAQDKLHVEISLLPSESLVKKPNSTGSTGECDLAVGQWVPDPTGGPLYSPDHCRTLSQAQNCRGNGRPDHGYEFYKWEPDQCSLPRLDPLAFLELMRGKTLAFVGDSLARNQMESLMCILLQAAESRARGSKNIHKWYFPSHKFTLIRMWSSWLVKTNGDFPPSDPPPPPGVTNLNLTELDEFAEHLPNFDVTILSSGHWWLRKTAYFLHGEMLGGTGWSWPTSHYGKMKINQTTAFGIAVENALQKVGSYPGYKGLTILRTYTPDHYSGGSWDTGGSCTGSTKPYEKGPRNSFNEVMRHKQLQAFEVNRERSEDGVMPNGSKLKLLDVYPALNYRGDGHPGPYRNTDPMKRTTVDSKGKHPPQDCLHWCLPGPIDTMNELLFHVLRKEIQ